MKHISFALTTAQVRARTKTVTRRMGWLTLKPGERLQGVVKSQGLRKGEKVEKLAVIEVVSVRREPVRNLLNSRIYGLREIRLEGFADDPELGEPGPWVQWFCKGHGCRPEAMVTRIEFKYLEAGE